MSNYTFNFERILELERQLELAELEQKELIRHVVELGMMVNAQSRLNKLRCQLSEIDHDGIFTDVDEKSNTIVFILGDYCGKK